MCVATWTLHGRSLNKRDPGALLGVGMARGYQLTGADRPGPVATAIGAPRRHAQHTLPTAVESAPAMRAQIAPATPLPRP